jgi:hypothetical protein
MPQKMWRHDSGSLAGMNCDQLSDDCIERNVSGGWRLTMSENMARYQYVTSTDSSR